MRADVLKNLLTAVHELYFDFIFGKIIFAVNKKSVCHRHVFLCPLAYLTRIPIREQRRRKDRSYFNRAESEPVSYYFAYFIKCFLGHKTRKAHLNVQPSFGRLCAHINYLSVAEYRVHIREIVSVFYKQVIKACHLPSLSQLHFFYFFKQLRNYFILAYFFEYFAVLKYHTAAVTAGYADVCLLSFARAVYDAPHNGNLYRLTAAS